MISMVLHGQLTKDASQICPAHSHLMIMMLDIHEVHYFIASYWVLMSHVLVVVESDNGS
jgi:hypothetical protein